MYGYIHVMCPLSALLNYSYVLSESMYVVGKQLASAAACRLLSALSHTSCRSNLAYAEPALEAVTSQMPAVSPRTLLFPLRPQHLQSHT